MPIAPSEAWIARPKGDIVSALATVQAEPRTA